MSSVTSRRAVGRASVLGYPPSRGGGGGDPRRVAVIDRRCRNPLRAMSVPAADLDHAYPGVTLHPEFAQLGVVGVRCVRRNQRQVEAE